MKTKFKVFAKRISVWFLVAALCCCFGCDSEQTDSNPVSQGQQSASSNNQSSDDSSTNNSDSSSSVESDAEIIKLEKPTITVSSQVGTDVCVIAGYCSLNTERIVISGDNATSVSTVPFPGKDKRYFITQVNYFAPTKLAVKAVDKNGNQTDPSNAYVGHTTMKQEYMYRGEYSPVFGKNGQTHYYSALLSYSLNTGKLSSQMSKTANKNISKIISTAKDYGAETIFVIIPSSADIYPETVPTEFSEAQGERLYERFEKIAKQNGAKVIYPIDIMKAHSNDGEGYQIYQHTDSHWSTYGAYWGTYDLFSYISQKFPSAKPRTLAEMDFYTAELYGGDALFSFPKELKFENYYAADRTTAVTKIKELTTLYNLSMPTNTLKTVYSGGNCMYLNDDNAAAKKEVNSGGNSLPTALIMRDSFSKVSYDMVNDRFSTVYWGEFNNYKMPLDIVDTNKLDYVIYIYSERNLLKIMMNTADATIVGLK